MKVIEDPDAYSSCTTRLDPQPTVIGDALQAIKQAVTAYVDRWNVEIPVQ